VVKLLVAEFLCYGSTAGNLNIPQDRSSDNLELDGEPPKLMISTSNSSNSTPEMVSTRDRGIPRDSDLDPLSLPKYASSGSKALLLKDIRDPDSGKRSPGCRSRHPQSMDSNHDGRSTRSPGRLSLLTVRSH